MAFSRIQSVQLSGLRATEVVVETDITRGLYAFQIVGLPDKSVAESRERVSSALRNSGIKNPKKEQQKITIALSPAVLRKEGAYADTAMAVGYLTASGIITADTSNCAFVGELSLSGEVKPVRGIIPIAVWATANGITTLYVPRENEQELRLLGSSINVTVYLVPTLADLVSHLQGNTSNVAILSPARMTGIKKGSIPGEQQNPFGAIKGRDLAKRGLLSAAAGGHNSVLWGPPGTGKTTLSRAMHSLLPSLDDQEFLEVATIYSSVGKTADIVSRRPPLRSPHHSTSHTAMIGGGTVVHPGEITLAHRGVLCMDEFLEFDKKVLEALRQPLEDGKLSLTRNNQHAVFPCRFMLVASLNPCMCGYKGSAVKPCTCTISDIARYTKKLSGPIADRIDLWIPVHHVAYQAIHANALRNETTQMASLVTQARSMQKRRYSQRDETMLHDELLNSTISTEKLNRAAQLSAEASDCLQSAAATMSLSPRSYIRCIRVARTIADLEGSDIIKTPHILEALQYKMSIGG